METKRTYEGSKLNLMSVKEYIEHKRKQNREYMRRYRAHWKKTAPKTYLTACEKNRNNIRSKIGARLRSRICAWVAQKLTVRNSVVIKEATDYLHWLAKERGLDLKDHVIHHLNPLAKLNPFDSIDYGIANSPANLWFLDTKTNQEIHCKETPKEIVELANAYYHRWIEIRAKRKRKF